MPNPESPYAPIFAFVPALYPIVLEILGNHKLTGPEFFVLSYLKHHGQDTSQGRGILISDLLAKVQQASSRAESTASRSVTELVNRNYVRKNSIPAAERAKLFPDGEGHNTVVVITTEGMTLLTAVNVDAADLIDHLVTGGLSKKFLRWAISELDRNARVMVARLESWPKGGKGRTMDSSNPP